MKLINLKKSKIKKKRPLPTELLFEIIKEINVDIYKNAFLNVEKRTEWSKFAKKLMTSSSLIYKLSGKIFKKVKANVMRERWIICPICRDRNSKIKYKNFKQHFLDIHQKIIPSVTSYDILKQLKKMLGIKGVADSQQILNAVANRYYYLENCLKSGNVTAIKDEICLSDNFTTKIISEIRQKYRDRKPVNVQSIVYGLAKVDSLTRKLLNEKKLYGLKVEYYYAAIKWEGIIRRSLIA